MSASVSMLRDRTSMPCAAARAIVAHKHMVLAGDDVAGIGETLGDLGDRSRGFDGPSTGMMMYGPSGKPQAPA